MKDTKIKLVKCNDCKGKGSVYCCSDHTCSGFRDCYRCNGTGKTLSPKDRRLKERLQKLLEYK